MKFLTSKIRQEALDNPYFFKGTVDVSTLESLNNDIRKIEPVEVDGFCTVDQDEFIFSYTIQGKMILPCARTLVDVPYSFSIEATEVFTTKQSLTEEEEEDEVHQLTDDTIDLTPYIIQSIVLETPYRVFSDDAEIEGGDGWDFYEEDERRKQEEKKIDPRLAKLQVLLDKKKQDE